MLKIGKVFKQHAEKVKWDMRTEAQFRSDSSNTSACTVRLESSMTWGQILANYVRVKKNSFPSLQVLPQLLHFILFSNT